MQGGITLVIMRWRACSYWKIDDGIPELAPADWIAVELDPAASGAPSAHQRSSALVRPLIHSPCLRLTLTEGSRPLLPVSPSIDWGLQNRRPMNTLPMHVHRPDSSHTESVPPILPRQNKIPKVTDVIVRASVLTVPFSDTAHKSAFRSPWPTRPLPPSCLS